jgi:hypothetical protein
MPFFERVEGREFGPWYLFTDRFLNLSEDGFSFFDDAGIFVW